MKVFVTGGHGFIGSSVVRILNERGYDVRCLVRKTSNTYRIDDLTWEKFVGDVRDTESIIAGVEGCDAVIHLASISSWADMSSDVLEDTVVGGTRKVVEAARDAGVKRFIYVSSSTAVNASKEPKVFDETSPFELVDPKYRYPIAKSKVEEIVFGLATDDFDVVVVNPAEVYGPRDDAFVTAGNLRDFIKDWPALACSGGTAVTHVEDVAEGMVLALEKGVSGERYILGGDNLDVEQLARLTLEIAGQRKPVIRIPNGLLLAVIGGLHKLGLPTPVEPEVVVYATLYWFVDSSKAKRELGYSPRPARDVLTSVIAWLYKEGHVKATAGSPFAEVK